MKNKLYLIKYVLVITAVLYLNHIFAADTVVSTKNAISLENEIGISYPTIKSDISVILNNNNKNLLKTNFGIAVYSTKLNKFIYQNNYKKKLTPASNTKLFTTIMSYTNLGENYNISTSVCYDGNITNGVLTGNLYLVGGGDPLFSISDIEIIADAIKEFGINKINGNIYGDCSYFDEITDRYKYSNDLDEVQSVQPITALSIEKNIVTVIVTSGSISGKPLTVQYKPASSAFSSTVTATVASLSTEDFLDNPDLDNIYYTRSKLNSYDEIDYTMLAGDALPVLLAARKKTKNTSRATKKTSSPISIRTTATEDGRQHFTVTGSLPKNRTYTYQYYIKNPAIVAAASLKDRLQAGGIVITGTVEVKNICSENPANKTPIFTFKRNINDVIVPTNKFSDNYLAESLFKLNGATAGYDKNCAKSSIISTNNTIKKLEICTDEILLNDGSGLSRRNLVTAESLVKLLYFSTKKPFYKYLDSSLSIAGIDGTLSKRMKNTLAMNNLRAKTGTLRNVSSLAGYVNTKNNDTLVFAFIFNGGNVGTYKELENKIGEILATY